MRWRGGDIKRLDAGQRFRRFSFFFFNRIYPSNLPFLLYFHSKYYDLLLLLLLLALEGDVRGYTEGNVVIN